MLADIEKPAIWLQSQNPSPHQISLQEEGSEKKNKKKDKLQKNHRHATPFT